MDRVPKIRSEGRTADVVDFDEALLDALPQSARAAALAEADLLARAFAPEGAAGELEAMARALSSGARDREMDRPHARRLAAALRRLAKRRAA
jgi:hypothetical protein